MGLIELKKGFKMKLEYRFTGNERKLGDFENGGYLVQTDYELSDLITYLGESDDFEEYYLTGAYVKIDNGEYSEIWVTESNPFYSNGALYKEVKLTQVKPELKDCTFYIIYSRDWDKNDLWYDKPPKFNYSWRKWVKTEGNEQAEYTYDGLTLQSHSKHCTIDPISYDDFVKFMEREDLHYSGETMGSLTFDGWLPALSFSNGVSGGRIEYLANAYVTIFPPEWAEPNQTDWDNLNEELRESF